MKTRQRQRPIRVNPSRLPPVPPPPPSRGSFLFPWLLATGAGALLLMLIAMVLVKPLRILPMSLYLRVVDAIAVGAFLVALLGCILALLRHFRHSR